MLSSVCCLDFDLFFGASMVSMILNLVEGFRSHPGLLCDFIVLLPGLSSSESI